MTAKETLVQALEGLGYPVYNLNYQGESETYFVYQAIAAVPDGYSDDDYTCLIRHFRVNLYTRLQYSALLMDTLTALRNAGFTISGVDSEMYEQDTNFFHIPISVNILEED